MEQFLTASPVFGGAIVCGSEQFLSNFDLKEGQVSWFDEGVLAFLFLPGKACGDLLGIE
jgi:hypothetical protein